MMTAVALLDAKHHGTKHLDSICACLPLVKYFRGGWVLLEEETHWFDSGPVLCGDFI